MVQNYIFPKHLKISALRSSNEIKPYKLMSKNGNISYFLDAFVIPLLTQALGFSYEVLPPEDNSFGSDTPSGNWTGLIGMVQSGQADIAIGIMITENRSKVVDFSFPYVFTDVSFVTDKPVYLPKSFAIFNPFSLWVWIALLVFLFSMSFFIYVLVSKKYSFAVVLSASYGILLEHSLVIKVRKRSVRILILSWIIGALFITNCYKTVLLAFLSFPSMTGIYDIRGLSQASKTQSFRCRTMPGSYLYNLLMSSKDALFEPIAKCVKRNSWDSRSNSDFLGDINVKKALMTTRRVLAQFRMTYFLSEDSFFPCPVGVVVGKTFCCKKAISRVIHRLFSFGLLQKCENDVSYFSSLTHFFSTPTNENTNEKLSLDDLSGAFAILTVGLTCASIILILEVIIHRIKRRKKKLCEEL